MLELRPQCNIREVTVCGLMLIRLLEFGAERLPFADMVQ
jgi:hypothetical protein